MGCNRSRIYSLKRKTKEKEEASTSLMSKQCSVTEIGLGLFLNVCNVHVFVNKQSCNDCLHQEDPV